MLKLFINWTTVFNHVVLLLIVDFQNITQQRNNNNKSCKTIILFLDGIYYLMASKQEALHNLFEWPIRTPMIRDSATQYCC